MSTVNASSLITKLQTLIDTSYITGTTKSDELISLVLSNALTENQVIITVPNVIDLPTLSLYDSPDGMIYFVTSLGIFAISSNLKWMTLDNKILRTDSEINQIYSWGLNSCGQLGDNTVISKQRPSRLFTNDLCWSKISSFNNHSAAIRSDGSMWTWGCNECGELGNGTTINQSSPVSVVGGFTDWCQVSVGTCTTFGLRTNGSLWGWGNNADGNLASSYASGRNVCLPVLVNRGGFNDWCQVSAGARHAMGIRTNGTLWGWGRNGAGELGDGTIVCRSSPVSVVGGFTDWCYVSAGNGKTLGLRSNGTLWGWGADGRALGLGSASTTFRSSPVQVIGGITDWCYVSINGDHTLALRSDGTAWAWGLNSSGQLGNNTVVSTCSPIQVSGGFTDWCSLDAGFSHSIGIRTNGTVWTWGCNNFGQLGDRSLTNRSSPVSICTNLTGWCGIAAGWCHSVGILTC